MTSPEQHIPNGMEGLAHWLLHRTARCSGTTACWRQARRFVLASIVAVDWVGASKMGLDPKVSQYMQLAVRAFGKPSIQLVGDPNPYRGWLNVPVGLSLFARFGLDTNYHFGNLFYLAGAYMDEAQFHFKAESDFMRAARTALRPIQEPVFLQSGGQRTRANRALAKVFAWLARDPNTPLNH